MKGPAHNAGFQEVEAFLFHEARLLDEALYDEWLDLFTVTAWYWVPIDPQQDNPFDSVSIIYDDRKLLETRVRRLQNANSHAQSPPARTSRLIGNVMRTGSIPSDDAYKCDYAVSSRFQMAEFRGGHQRIFAGAVSHGLVCVDDGFRICWKRVDLVNCDGMMEGITIPF